MKTRKTHVYKNPSFKPYRDANERTKKETKHRCVNFSHCKSYAYEDHQRCHKCRFSNFGI